MSDRHSDDDSPFWPRGNSTDVNSRILLIAIISLSVVVVVVTMLHVYARYLLRRQARHRASLQGIGIVARIHSDEPPKRGLEPMVIASLPILIYKDIDRSGHECTVCLSRFEGGQTIRVLPNCNHHFHSECIDKWLGSQSTCPICRHQVDSGPSLMPLPREPSTRVGPLERTGSIAGTPDEEAQSFGKVNGTTVPPRVFEVNGSNSRMSSFRRMLSMDRSSRHVNSCTQDDGVGVEDLERQ